MQQQKQYKIHLEGAIDRGAIKDLLIQYSDLQEEIKEKRKKVSEIEDLIEKLKNEGTVVDKVKGGLGGEQGFKIEGFPEKEYKRRISILKRRNEELAKSENDLLEQMEKIELFIEQIPNSRDRRIFEKMFLENKTQQQIAREIHLERSTISKIVNKYL